MWLNFLVGVAAIFLMLLFYGIPIWLLGRRMSRERLMDDSIWVATAERRGLDFAAEALGDEVEVRKHPFDARSKRMTWRRGPLVCAIEARFWPKSLDGHRVRGRIVLAGALPGGTTVEQTGVMGQRHAVATGDHDFDKRFAVQGEGARQALEVLTPDLRRALLELSQHVRVKVDHKGVNWMLNEALDDRSGLAEVIDAMDEVADALQEASTAPWSHDVGTANDEFAARQEPGPKASQAQEEALKTLPSGLVLPSPVAEVVHEGSEAEVGVTADSRNMR